MTGSKGTRKTRREGFVPECSFERLNELLRAFEEAGACKSGVSYKSVAELLGKDETWVSRNAKFLLRAGFLMRERRAVYKLTDKGCQYVRALELKLYDDAVAALREILSEYDLTSWIHKHLRVKGPLSREELVRRIALHIDVPLDTSRFRVGINAFVDMLLNAGLLIQGDDGLLRAPSERIVPKPVYAEVVYNAHQRFTESKELVEFRYKHIHVTLKPCLDDIEIIERWLDMLRELLKTKRSEKAHRTESTSVTNPQMQEGS